MKVLYIILAAAGWAWLVMAAAGLYLRIRQVDCRRPPTLDPIPPHEK
jgi:hypothetical protein